MALTLSMQTLPVSTFPSHVLVDSTPHLAVVREPSQGGPEPLQDQPRACRFPPITPAASLYKIFLTGKGVL
jgi:hypothetical protein